MALNAVYWADRCSAPYGVVTSCERLGIGSVGDYENARHNNSEMAIEITYNLVRCWSDETILEVLLTTSQCIFLLTSVLPRNR